MNAIANRGPKRRESAVPARPLGSNSRTSAAPAYGPVAWPHPTRSTFLDQVGRRESPYSLLERLSRSSRTLDEARAAAPEVRALKERLLQTVLADVKEERVAKLFRLAAGEAEALAWSTPFPSLMFPTLLEEKLKSVQKYLAVQAEFRRSRVPTDSYT